MGLWHVGWGGGSEELGRGTRERLKLKGVDAVAWFALPGG